MNDLVKDKEKVANFFKHPSIAYAAWFFSLFDGGVIIDLMDKCIEEVHYDGSYDINRPRVYKSLDRGKIKKVNI